MIPSCDPNKPKHVTDYIIQHSPLAFKPSTCSRTLDLFTNPQYYALTSNRRERVMSCFHRASFHLSLFAILLTRLINSVNSSLLFGPTDTLGCIATTCHNFGDRPLKLLCIQDPLAFPHLLLSRTHNHSPCKRAYYAGNGSSGATLPESMALKKKTSFQAWMSKP